MFLLSLLTSCKGSHIGIFNTHYEEPVNDSVASLEVENMMSYSKPKVYIYENSIDCSGKRYLWDDVGVRAGFNKLIKVKSATETTVGMWYGLGRTDNSTKYCDGKITFTADPEADYLLQLSGYENGCIYELFKVTDNGQKEKVEYTKRESFKAFSNESASCKSL